MSNEFNLVELLAGIGIFLFGMFQMEEALKQLSGGSFRRLLRRFTKNWFRSVSSGAIATAILQSSTAVSLMVLAFAGAGVLGMESAIGVVIGSNLGTTLTSWVVAALGFKIDIALLALPFIGAGGLGLIFFSNSRRGGNICKFLLGFGFLFLGLDYMKTSIDDLAQHYDFAGLSQYHWIVYIVAGFFLTAIIQSSTASVAIIQSAVHTGILAFPVAAYMVIGINVGTTLTVMIGSLGSQTIKKRVAFSHLLFNLVAAILVTILFPLLIYFVQDVARLENNPVTGIALFHTLFNLIGVIVFFPLIGFLTNVVVRVIREKKATITRYLHTLKPDVTQAGIEALRNENRHLVVEVIRYHLRLLKLTKREPFQSFLKRENVAVAKEPSLENMYQQVKLLEAEIYTFASGLQVHELRDEEVRELNTLLHATRNAVASAKILKDVQHDFQEAENSDNAEIEKLMVHVKEKWAATQQEFIALLEEKESSTNISLIHGLMLKNKEDDIAFTQLITAAIASKKISQADIPTQITLNRAFNISVRQMIDALRDLLFTEPEAEIVEKLAEQKSITV
ncbi:MAG: Na/Pi cotransporter family protein [Cyclobacteriaceae bacterium]|nr:Na/Pi cotransporter family protein [Cyclobacteriaceae bacterium]